jgi:tetratricopeptide (TPR) repeat protein
MRSQFVKARDYFSRDRQICQEIDDIDGEGQALGNLGYVELCLGNYAQAEDFIQQDLNITRQTGNRHSEAEALMLMGLCKNVQAQWAEAAALFNLGQQISNEIGDQEIEMYALGGLGNALTGLNRAEEGATLLRQSVVGYRVLQMEAFAMESLAGWVRAQLSLERAPLTMPAVDKLMDHLHTVGPFYGADAPMLILWTCYQALTANRDARAKSVLKMAVGLLETAVSYIPDEATRQSFLENVSWHREITLATSERMFYN